MLDGVTIAHTVDQARGERFARTYGLAGQHHLQAARGPNESRQSLGTAAPRQQTQCHFGKAELRFGRGDPVVPREGELEPPAQAQSSDRHHDRFARSLDPVL